MPRLAVTQEMREMQKDSSQEFVAEAVEVRRNGKYDSVPERGLGVPLLHC